MRAVFKQPGYPQLFTGTATATVGDSLMLLVLAIWVKDLTGSNGAAGLTMFFLGAPMLAAPLFAMFVDRFPHRPFLVVANLVNAVFLIPLFFVDGSGDVWLVYLTAFLLGVGSTVDGPALNGLLKKVLPADMLVEANGLSQTVRQGMRLAGPLVGAGIYLFGGGMAVAVVNAVCLILAAVAIGFVPIREKAVAPRTNRWRSELVAGFKFLGGQAGLRRASLGLLLAGGSLGSIEAVGFAIVDDGLGRSPEFISVIVTVMGVGGLLGGVFAARTVKRLGELATAGLALGMIAVTTAVWIVPNVVSVLAAAPMIGAALPLMVVSATTLVQRVSPTEIIGRVSSAMDQSFAVPQVASVALGALLVTAVDYRLVLVGMTVMLAVAAGYLYVGRKLTAPVPPVDTAA